MRTASQKEYLAEIKAQGVPKVHVAFKCPVCRTIQSSMSLIRAGAGEDLDAVQRTIGFSCVGRFTGAGSHKKDAAPGKGCNWTLGGLFQINTYAVISEDGKEHALFEPATPAEAQALMEVNKPLGIVAGREVFKGDVLYVDIRGTCATTWGAGQVAQSGANEGQGPMIVFEGGDYRMNTALVWHPVIETTIPPELLAIARNIKHQSGRSTSHPMFQIQQEREIMVDPDYHEATIVWRENTSGDYEQATPLRSGRLEALFQAKGEQRKGYSRYATMMIWETVSSCFTRMGADEFIKSAGRDLKSPRVYVASGWQNKEYQTVRDFLLSIVPGAQ